MDEKRIKELFQQTGETLQAILEYFRLKDKVLWTGSAGKGKTITVPNLSKYSLIRIKAVYGDFLVNTSAGRVRGIYGDRQGSSDTLVTGLLFASISGDSLTINNCNWVVHSPSGSHGAISQTTITEIIGIDPVIPAALQNIIGGGYCIRKILGGGIGALIQPLKEYYSCYKQRKESNKEYKEPVLSHLSERSLGNICDDIYSVLPKEFTCRGLFSSRTSGRKCKQYNNDSECYDECGDKFRDIIVWLWKRNIECWRRRPYVGATGSHEKRRRRESYDIQICIKCDYIWRKACSDQTDITDWGCAA